MRVLKVRLQDKSLRSISVDDSQVFSRHDRRLFEFYINSSGRNIAFYYKKSKIFLQKNIDFNVYFCKMKINKKNLNSYLRLLQT